jgi:hypothetical protein
MGCCQCNSETGEVLVVNLHEKIDQATKGLPSDEQFDEVSLDSKEEETACVVRYTDSKVRECFVTVRSTSYSFHRTEIEQSFLQTKNCVNFKDL